MQISPTIRASGGLMRLSIRNGRKTGKQENDAARRVATSSEKRENRI